jgi:hypothetical protein
LRRWYASGVYLVVCALVGSAVGQYGAIAQLGERRGLGTPLVLRASFMHLDLAHASLGLALGLASLTALGWVRRGR